MSTTRHLFCLYFTFWQVPYVTCVQVSLVTHLTSAVSVALLSSPVSLSVKPVYCSIVFDLRVLSIALLKWFCSTVCIVLIWLWHEVSLLQPGYCRGSDYLSAGCHSIGVTCVKSVRGLTVVSRVFIVVHNNHGFVLGRWAGLQSTYLHVSDITIIIS